MKKNQINLTELRKVLDVIVQQIADPDVLPESKAKLAISACHILAAYLKVGNVTETTILEIQNIATRIKTYLNRLIDQADTMRPNTIARLTTAYSSVMRVYVAIQSKAQHLKNVQCQKSEGIEAEPDQHIELDQLSSL